MTRLSLVWESFKQEHSLPGLLFGVDRNQARKARRRVIKADTQEQREIKKIFKKLSDSSNKYVRDEVILEIKNLKKTYHQHFEQEIDMLIKISLPTIIRQFRRLNDLKEKSKGVFTDKQNELKLKAQMKGIHDWTLEQFDIVQKRNSFTAYASDEITMHAEFEHILDPFNLQKDIRTLHKDEERFSALLKSAKNRYVKRKTYDYNSEQAKRFKIDQEQLERYLSAIGKDLNSVFEKLKLAWKDMVLAMQQERDKDAEVLKGILDKLSDSGFPRADLEICKVETQQLSSDIEKLFRKLQDNINAAILLES